MRRQWIYNTYTHPPSPPHAKSAADIKITGCNATHPGLLREQLKDCLHTDVHISQSVLTDYCRWTITLEGCGVGGGNRDSIATLTKVIFPQYPCVGYILHCLLLRRTSRAVVRSQAAAQPIGSRSRSPLPSPLCSPRLHRLFARHFIFLFNNQPWKCVGRKMAKYRRSHNSSHGKLSTTRRGDKTEQGFAVCWSQHWLKR